MNCAVAFKLPAVKLVGLFGAVARVLSVLKVRGIPIVNFSVHSFPTSLLDIGFIHWKICMQCSHVVPPVLLMVNVTVKQSRRKSRQKLRGAKVTITNTSSMNHSIVGEPLWSLQVSILMMNLCRFLVRLSFLVSRHWLHQFLGSSTKFWLLEY